MLSRIGKFGKLVVNSPEKFICKCQRTTDAKLNQFINPAVQKILRQLTHVDLEKVFERRKFKRPIEPFRYKLLTNEELKRQQRRAFRKADVLLQMPPILESREEINEILSNDSSLDGFDKDHSKYVFTDISSEVTNEERVVVVREPNGILRKAYWSERHKVNQIYFPLEGRYLKTPKAFEEENLNSLLEREEYKFILDFACVQFEPDDPIYVKVSRIVYDKINERFHFSKLHSTRHFGSMTFYLVIKKNIDNMLLDNIHNQRIEDAYLLVNLYHLIHPECKSASSAEKSDIENLQSFIAEDANNRQDLELALQVFLSKNNEEKSMSAI